MRANTVIDSTSCPYPDARKPSLARARGMAGFTLIELLVTISIAAIVLTLAIPSFRDFLLNSRMTTQTNELVLALSYARSEAIKRNATINVCKNADTTTDCGEHAEGWSNGWTVFIDSDDDCVVDSTEVVLQTWPALDGNTLCLASLNTDRVKFRNTGYSPGYNGTFTLCDSRGDTEARGLILSSLGRVYRASDSDNDSIEEDGSGVNLTCP